MINIYICEDNEILLNNYKSAINKQLKKIGIVYNIYTYKSGEALLFDTYDNTNNINILFIDIEMKKINGIETCCKLRNLGCKAEIIYLTSFEEYVFDVFDTSPLGYIVKSDNAIEKIDNLLSKALKKINTSKYFTCKSSKGILKVEIDDIYYFEVKSRIITICYDYDNKFNFYFSIKDLVNTLDSPNFIRVHKSFVVNVKYIKYFSKNQIVLSNNDTIPVGRVYTKYVKGTLANHLYDISVYGI